MGRKIRIPRRMRAGDSPFAIDVRPVGARRTLRFSKAPQGFDNSIDLFGAFGVFAAEMCRELFRACAGIRGEDVADEGDLVRQPFRPR